MVVGNFHKPRETKMTNEGMPVPHWVDEAREQMFDGHSQLNYDNAEVKPRQLPVVENFSNLFAEYEVRDGDLLVHVFPRNGGEDRYWPPEVKEDGTYVGGRLEEIIAGVSFPNDIVNRIKDAVDKVWQGDVAIDKATLYHYGEQADVAEDDPVEVDLAGGAYAVQFQNAANTVTVVGVEKFVDQFCEELDRLLE
jgi:hypothetical protein